MSDTQFELRSPTAVVVAHPDDEVLWLSGVVSPADRVGFCFGDSFEKPKASAARRRAGAALPLTRPVDPKVPGRGAGFLADSAHPRLTAAGSESKDAAA